MSDPYHYEQYPEPRPEPSRVPVPYVTPLTDQQPISTPVVVISWIAAVLGGFYLLPWAVAASRGKANQWSVFLINLLLGWTIVGWIVALVLSCTAHRPLALVSPGGGYGRPALALPPAGWYPNPNGPGRRYWDGREWTQHFA